MQGKDELGNHFAERTSDRIAPFDFSETARLASGNIDDSGIVHDTAVFAESVVEITGGRDIESDDEINIVITMGKIEVVFGDGGLVRSDENFDVITFELVTEVIGFVFVERDDKIA